MNYPTIQKELLAIVWSVKYFRPYLFGRKFTIMTDHKPLMYLFGMKDPSNRLLKFRLQLEEYDFAIIYIPGQDNVVADALSRVAITSSELKDINQKLTSAMIMTRAQTKKKEEEERMRNNASTESTKFSNMTTDLRPKIVEILRKPSDSVELKFIKRDELDKLRKINKVTKEEKCLAFVEDQLIIYINLNYMSHFTRDEFADILRVFCNKIKVEEICVIKNNESAIFIEELCKEINKRKTWSGPRILILKNIKRISNKDEKTMILNDFHLLPTAGHAGVR